MDPSTSKVVLSRVHEVEGTLSPSGLSALLKRENIDELILSAQARLYARKIKLTGLGKDDLIRKYEIQASGYAETINPMTGIVKLIPCSVREMQVASKTLADIHGLLNKDKTITHNHTLETFLNRVSSKPFGLPSMGSNKPILIKAECSEPEPSEPVEPTISPIAAPVEPKLSDAPRLPQPPKIHRKRATG